MQTICASLKIVQYKGFSNQKFAPRNRNHKVRQEKLFCLRTSLPECELNNFELSANSVICYFLPTSRSPHAPVTSRLLQRLDMTYVLLCSHAIVSSPVGPEYYVHMTSFVDKTQIEPGCTVLLHNKVSLRAVLTNHKSLTFLGTLTQSYWPSDQMDQSLAPFDLDVKYKPGKENHVADALSRRPDFRVCMTNLFPI